MSDLVAFVEAFYQLTVLVVGPVDASSWPRKGDQLRASDALELAVRCVRENRQASRRVIATLAITNYDLVAKDLNFVYGFASAFQGGAIVSMHRFSDFDVPPVDMKRAVFCRLYKVVCHELGHLFGLRHCIAFRCLMNGVNHADELDNLQRIIECPVCTKKLTHGVGWDLARRYDQLAEVMDFFGFEDGSLVKVLSNQLKSK